MNTRMKLLSIELSLTLVVWLCPIQAFARSAAPLQGASIATQSTGSYGVNLGSAAYTSANPYYPTYSGECTWYAWGRAYEKLGVALPFTGNANDWTSLAASRGYATGTEARANSIMVEHYSGTGHVFFVESVANGYAYVSEGNYLGSYHEDAINLSTHRRQSWPTQAMGSIDYVYLSGSTDQGPTPPSGSVPIRTGVYHLTPKCATAMHLDVADGSAEGGANVQLSTAHAGTAQSFGVVDNGSNSYFIKPICSDLLLDISGNKTDDGTNVSQWSDTGAAGQRWVFQDAGDGWYYIRSTSGMYLDVANAGTTPQTNVWVYSFNGSDAQKWRLDRTGYGVTNGVYMLAPKHAADLRLGVQGEADQPGSNIQLQSRDNTLAQAFGVSGTGKGYYLISPRSSGLLLDVSGNSEADGANIAQWSDTGALGQHWTFQEAGGGYYYVRSESGMYLDVANAGKTAGTNVWAWSYNGSDAQRWALIRVRELSEATVSVSDAVYTGSPLTPAPTVKAGSTTLAAGTDYTVSYKDNIAVGTATVTISGAGNYVGTKTATFKIAAPVQTEPADPGKPADPSDPAEPTDPATPTVPTDPTTPTQPTEPANPTDPKTPAGPTEPADPVIPADQDPAADTSKDDKLQTGGETTQPASIAKAAVTGVKSKIYTGKALAQSPTVKVGGEALKAGADYEIAYENNVKAGTATMTITGKGSYTGTKAVTFAINKANVKNATAAKVKAQKYRKGKAVKPNPKITYKGKRLKKGTDYTLKYKNNKKRGTATITVKGKGNFTGSKAVKFKIK